MYQGKNIAALTKELLLFFLISVFNFSLKCYCTVKDNSTVTIVFNSAVTL